MSEAEQIIARLGLAAHPEGGWYRQTWRDAPADGSRGQGSMILFMLQPGERSHWHRVDAAEHWIFQAGGPLTLKTFKADQVVSRILGADIVAGDQPQVTVDPGEWQSAESGDRWSLVACVCVPGFEWTGFELSEPGWSPTAG